MPILFSLLVFSCSNNASEKSTDSEADTATDSTDGSQSITEEDTVLFTVFAATDVPQSSIDRTTEWLTMAQDLWYTENTFGWDNDLYDPVYLVMVGEDMQSTIDLEQRYCEHLEVHHAETISLTPCNYPDPNCQDGICFFTEYVTNGGAGIASSRQNHGYHLMIMAAKNPSPEEEDYKKVVLHEAFHIYQLSQHNEMDYDKAEEIMGRRSGDHNDNVPWWSEGTAEYMAVYHYSQQEGVSADYLENEMRNKIGYYGDTEAFVINEYFENNTKLYNITFDDNGHLGYHLGAWLVAYLVHDFGHQSIFDFYQNAHLMTFDDNFMMHFGQDYRSTIDEFEVFLQQEDTSLLLDIIQ